jgi:hypothetical protein
LPNWSWRFREVSMPSHWFRHWNGTVKPKCCSLVDTRPDIRSSGAIRGYNASEEGYIGD